MDSFLFWEFTDLVFLPSVCVVGTTGHPNPGHIFPSTADLESVLVRTYPAII